MRLRTDLETLATLDATTIEAVCTEPSLVAHLITECLEEAIELDDLADQAHDQAQDELAWFYRQEAAAWRATVRVLRAAHDTSLPRPQATTVGRGVA